VELRVRLQPKQSELWKLWDGKEYTRIGFGGARGGAKSGGGRRCMLLRRMQYPKTTGLILRRTYPELYKSHIVKLFEEYPFIRAWYNEQRKEIAFPNGSYLFFGSAEHEKDMSAYYSSEFADIMVDEAQEFSQYELEQLSGSNRSTSNSDITPKMIYTFMPGLSEAGLPPKGLNYLKRVFVDRKLRGEEQRSRWAFIQAFAWDNIEWAKKALENLGVSEAEFYSWPEEQRRDYFIENTEFGAVLASLSSQELRDAWLYGKWGQFKGQYFDTFSYDEHTIAAEDIRIEPWHRRWVSGDWGDYHPAVFYWHAQDEHGRVTTYREFWSIGAGEAEMGRRIGELSKGENIASFWLSWDAFGKLNKDTRKPITELIGNALPKGFPRPVPADSSPGSRISGARLMKQLLDAKMWTISRQCERLIECLPTLVRDMERNPEDVLKVDHSDTCLGDDPYDAARYGLSSEIASVRKPVQIRVHERIAQIQRDEPAATMTHIMMAKARIEHEERSSAPRAIPIRRRWRYAH